MNSDIPGRKDSLGFMHLPRSLVVALVVGIAAPVFAQAPRGSQPSRPNAPVQAPARQDPGDMTPNEIQRMFEAWALVEAQDVLQLSDAQYGRFAPKMKALQDARRRHQQARQQILGDLRKLTTVAPGAPAPDEAAVRDRMKSLRAEEARAVADPRKAADGIDQVRDVPQQARFRLFEERMETRKLE